MPGHNVRACSCREKRLEIAQKLDVKWKFDSTRNARRLESTFIPNFKKKEKQSLQNGKFAKKNSKYLEYFAILNKMGVVQGIQVPARALSPGMQHPCCALRTGVSSSWAR